MGRPSVGAVVAFQMVVSQAQALPPQLLTVVHPEAAPRSSTPPRNSRRRTAG